MTEYDAPLDIDPAAQIFADVLMVAVREASKIIEERGTALTLNALMSGLVAVAAFHIAGIDDQRARKALLREMEKELPRAVARQRTREGGGHRGRVVTIYKNGGSLN